LFFLPKLHKIAHLIFKNQKSQQYHCPFFYVGRSFGVWHFQEHYFFFLISITAGQKACGSKISLLIFFSKLVSRNIFQGSNFFIFFLA